MRSGEKSDCVAANPERASAAQYCVLNLPSSPVEGLVFAASLMAIGLTKAVIDAIGRPSVAGRSDRAASMVAWVSRQHAYGLKVLARSCQPASKSTSGIC